MFCLPISFFNNKTRIRGSVRQPVRRGKTLRPKYRGRPELLRSAVPVAQRGPRRAAKRRTSFKRRLLLIWKRLTKPRRSRRSRRFSFMPEGFVRVEISRFRVRDSLRFSKA
ncbi:hypothetical protein Hypma_009106 [Hypsizygus marmoreus]|uniref:Uncharacterized protein n=1 Tax=Hypsizygus marmoreus TaxID=39966 RepID=A0A369JVF5_HYPMA|nr:hypothetical protein Hypma_009106 [Hypsizygus marmoreus]